MENQQFYHLGLEPASQQGVLGEDREPVERRARAAAFV